MFENDLILEERLHTENFKGDDQYLEELYDHLLLAQDNGNTYQARRFQRLIQDFQWEGLRKKLNA
jgi:hypothetical protein